MNIIQTETLKGWGGQQNKVINECLALKKQGHEVILICNPNADIISFAEEKNINFITYPMNKRNFHKTIPFFLKLFKTKKIDLIITHGSTDSWIGGLSTKLSSKKVISLRERHNLFPIKSYLSRWLHHTGFSGILSISDAVSDYLKSIGVENKNIYYLPDSVDVENFCTKKSTFREEFDIPDNALVIGTLTALRKEKGAWDCCNTLIKIMQNKNIWFVFGGKNYPETKSQILNKLKKHNIDTSRVIWTGFRNDIPNILNAFDIFLYPSHSEGLGTIILEAMACSLPIIVYNKRPMSDLIRNYKNGMVAEFGKIDELINCCNKLVDDPNLRKKIGIINREISMKKYSQGALEKRLENILKKFN
tara:strand:+ start:34005 stop:35090 length:1086 start_codon:yes stop_codon:yes gene_type:complete